MLITANTPFAFDMDDLRFGAKHYQTYRADLVRNDHVEAGRKNVLQRIALHELVAEQQPEMVSGFVSALYAHVWKGTIRCFQTKTEEHEALTNCARLFWTVHRYDEDILWYKAPDIEAKVSYRYAGYLGSLASYFLDAPQAQNTDLETLKALLRYFWHSLGIDHRLNPRMKQECLLYMSGYNWEFVLRVAKYLKALTNTPQFRLFALGIEHVSYLPLRLLLADVDPYLLAAIRTLLAEQHSEPLAIDMPLYRVLQYGKSAGLALAYQALHLDAAVGLIRCLEKSGLYTMDELRKNYEVRCEVAQRYREMADAYEVLDLLSIYTGLTKYRKLFSQQADLWKPEGFEFRNHRRITNGPSWLFAV